MSKDVTVTLDRISVDRIVIDRQAQRAVVEYRIITATDDVWDRGKAIFVPSVPPDAPNNWYPLGATWTSRLTELLNVAQTALENRLTS